MSDRTFPATPLYSPEFQEPSSLPFYLVTSEILTPRVVFPTVPSLLNSLPSSV